MNHRGPGLDEETKNKLKKLGIRDLKHTPGKPITAKGHIDGYLSAFGTVLGKIAANHMKDIIHPIWDVLGKSWDGYRYFMSVNNREVGNALDWSKLQISDGLLSPPKCICANRYDIEKGEIQLFVPRTIGRKPITINQMGIGIFDRVTGDLFHIAPERLTEELEQRLKAHGIKTWGLEKVKINSVIKPLRFRWEVDYTTSSKSEVHVRTWKPAT